MNPPLSNPPPVLSVISKSNKSTNICYLFIPGNNPTEEITDMSEKSKPTFSGFGLYHDEIISPPPMPQAAGEKFLLRVLEWSEEDVQKRIQQIAGQDPDEIKDTMRIVNQRNTTQKKLEFLQKRASQKIEESGIPQQVERLNLMLTEGNVCAHPQDHIVYENTPCPSLRCTICSKVWDNQFFKEIRDVNL